jgi:hypothetical protein
MSRPAQQWCLPHARGTISLVYIIVPLASCRSALQCAVCIDVCTVTFCCAKMQQWHTLNDHSALRHRTLKPPSPNLSPSGRPRVPPAHARSLQPVPPRPPPAQTPVLTSEKASLEVPSSSIYDPEGQANGLKICSKCNSECVRPHKHTSMLHCCVSHGWCHGP